jgi:tetratricopeptide (TPR) repeat protein
MFDPFYGYIFWTEKGEIATLEQIRKQGNKLHSAQFSAVKRLQGMVADDYFRLFEPAHDWEIHIPSTPIWLKYMDYYYDALGDSFLRFYQHLYFLESKTDLFTRARLKQLTWQFESALKDFECIIESDNVIEPPVLRIDFNSVTKDLLNGEARFFRGQTYFDMKAYEACIRSFEEYLRLHPENRWKKLAYYYLGACNEALGDKEKAVEWYSMIEGEELPGTPAPERLMAILGRD